MSSFADPKVRELMTKFDKIMDGYPRYVIVLACSRTIAAMLGPATPEARESFLKEFPNGMREMWTEMDKIVQ